jgi:predicted RNase H-like HicB family nuclease
MKKQIIVSEHIWKEGGMYTAFCPEIDVASCGCTVDEAKKNLTQLRQLFL